MTIILDLLRGFCFFVAMVAVVACLAWIILPLPPYGTKGGIERLTTAMFGGAVILILILIIVFAVADRSA